MNPKIIFYNKFERLRSGWRFALFLLVFIFCDGLFNFAAYTLFSKLKIDYSPGNLLFIVANSAVSLLLVVALGWLFGKYLEDLPFRALGCAFTKNWLRDLAWGLGLGSFTIILAILCAIIFGGLSFEFNRDAGTSAILTTLGLSFIVFVVAAAFEEAFFRGYILQTFARAHLAWLAIVLTSLFFAAGHLNNPSANVISTLNTILAGIWFSVAYLKTRALWFPFGLHLVWNWLQGAFFGIEVSGLKNLTAAPLLQEIDRGPAWLTGADYGIEGGIAATIAIILSIVVIYLLPLLKPTEEMLALTSEEKKAETLP
ncbi:MAG: type II CAAX endopeptidase family protein [Pyrinomonadaceae bacterium]